MNAHPPAAEDLAVFTVLKPDMPPDVWDRLVTFGLRHRGRPKKNGDAARPFSVGPVTMAELGFSKADVARCRALAAIPDGDFEELLAAFQREGRLPTAAGILRSWRQKPRRKYPASMERMAALLREAGWTVLPPERGR